MLGFASRTWDGWDYIPHAWPAWLDAPASTLVVGCIGQPVGGVLPLDAAGRPLAAGQPVAVARIAYLSPTEAWLEGIRVDPRVRGMGVATDLQVAELHVVAGRDGVDVIRYATGERNEGSHRLGGRHGFALLASFRTWAWRSDEADESGAEASNGFDEATRADATRRRQHLLDRLAEEGLVAPASAAAGLWQRVTANAGFEAAQRLYELRAWAMQELTQALFFDHARRGELLSIGGSGDDWAVALLSADAHPAEDVSIHLALLAGEGQARARLAGEIQRAGNEEIRFRLAHDDPASTPAETTALEAGGFKARDWQLHILGRRVGAASELPPVDARRVIVELD